MSYVLNGTTLTLVQVFCSCALTAGLLLGVGMTGKMDQAKELSGQLLSAYPGNAGIAMLQALLLAKSGKVC